jgi:hypothetical protein
MSQKEKSVQEAVVLVILIKIVHVSYSKRFPREKAISLYNSKIVDKKEIRTVSSTSIYCSRDKVDTVYLVNISALCISCEDMACCSSVQCTVYSTVK